MEQKSSKTLTFLFGALSAVLVILLIASISLFLKSDDAPVVVDDTTDNQLIDDKVVSSGAGIENEFKKFVSKEEFEAYMLAVEENSMSGMLGVNMNMNRGMALNEMAMTDVAMPMNNAIGVTDSAMIKQSAERVSETNVQVAGIDEPDIVKTNGSELFISSLQRQYYLERPMPMFDEEMVEGIRTPEEQQGRTAVLNAFPPEDMEEIARITEGGQLLLSDDTLIVLDNREIFGYNVSNPKKPQKIWNVSLEDRTQLNQARLHGGMMYMITQQSFSRYEPCPLTFFEIGGIPRVINCVDVYHPAQHMPIDTMYHVAIINPETGVIDTETSFLGSYNATVYMSQNSLYVGYQHLGALDDLVYEFFMQNDDIFPKLILDKVEKLHSYDLSLTSKMTELSVVIEEWYRTLNDDDELMLQNELENRTESYLDKHLRDITKTSIVKIDVKTLKAQSIGTIPGWLLNQFSLDEYDDNLRVAVTVGLNQWNSLGNVNDVYVLDKDMKTVGSVLGMGEDEKIYAVRFVGEKGYVVTFRQTDPFYVLDLSNPKKPEIKGELKIPGYSSYLHPIDKDTVIGIGKEGSKVKISLFDVSDPTNPTEASKYMLDEYWSDVQNTHHAFLLDSVHRVFFIPGSNGGYIFSYEKNELTMKKAVSNIQAKRAVYLDDYLYVIGSDKVIVLNENTWERVKEINLSSGY